MPHASQRSLPESAGELQRKILQVRRKARIILLGRALLVAIAADLIYDILSLGLFVLTGARTYFPLFFFVAWTVFSIYALRKTRLLTFNRSLDRQHRLKDRLTSALRYRTTGVVAAPMVAAQAKESLDAIDFQHLRQSFRFRPWYSLAVIALAMTTMASIKARFPEHFDPRNIVFRQAARLTDLYRHPGKQDAEKGCLVRQSNDWKSIDNALDFTGGVLLANFYWRISATNFSTSSFNTADCLTKSLDASAIVTAMRPVSIAA